MYYLQKHGENLEADPPIYGCLHPKWQKQHKDKLLSKEEWSALWQIEQCSMEPINPKRFSPYDFTGQMDSERHSVFLMSKKLCQMSG